MTAPPDRPVPPDFLLACQRLGVPLTRHLLAVSIASQSVSLFERSRNDADEARGARPSGRRKVDYAAAAGVDAGAGRGPALLRPEGRAPDAPLPPHLLEMVGPCYSLQNRFRCSTSKFGIGQVAGSNCTPLGLHRIVEKHGDGAPAGTVFKARQPVGHLRDGLPLESITTRILWLDGLDPGFNRGGNVDTFARYIYIHGFGDQASVGRPASHGCIHLADADLIPLYDELPIGTLVWIAEG